MGKSRGTACARNCMHFFLLFLCLVLVPIIGGCGGRVYKKEAGQRERKFTEEAFFSAIEDGEKEKVALYVKSGVDVNAVNESGMPASVLAAYVGIFETAELLIKSGADVNAKDNEGVTALMWAAANGDYELANLLIRSGADVNAANNRGSSALGWAMAAGQTSIADMLRAAGARQ